MTKKRRSKKDRERMDLIIQALNKEYGTEFRCFLNYGTPWQLLLATILSAQCTDERVNMVTEELFQKYRSIEDFASAEQKELEKDIHSTGFFRNKAKNIIECAGQLLTKYHGEVPGDILELTSLAGVGRKTANVIRGNIYQEPSIVVDTHVKRVSKRLGLTEEEDPVKVEYDLMTVLKKDQWISYNRQIITHGRSLCTARNPKCQECFLYNYCNYVTKAVPASSNRRKKIKKSLNE